MFNLENETQLFTSAPLLSLGEDLLRTNSIKGNPYTDHCDTTKMKSFFRAQLLNPIIKSMALSETRPTQIESVDRALRKTQ